MDTICIQDFCGSTRGFHVEYWADYDPTTGLVEFGGDWSEIPPTVFNTQPTDEDISEFANSYLED
jgi:hypothetical protein